MYAKAGVSGVNYDEFVVYESERVLQWLIAYPTAYVIENTTTTDNQNIF